MAVPYGKREFCKAMRCKYIRLHETTRKLACKRRCAYNAYDLHNWLQKQGYTIAKFPTPFVIEELEKNIYRLKFRF